MYTTQKQYARIAGLLYLIVIAAGLFAEVFVREALTVSNDAVATAHKIQAAEMRYRLGFVADIFNLICGLPVIVFFYRLYKPTHRSLILLAIFFVIISNAVIAVNLLNQVSTLMWLSGDHYLATFNPYQLATLSLHGINVQEEGYAIALVFFGCYCIILGYLIFKSTYMPRVLGILYALAGLCYMISSFTGFLMPGFRNPLFPFILIPSFIGELSVCLWLLIMGVKKE